MEVNYEPKKPKYLNTNPEELYADVINKRKTESEFIEKYFAPDIINFLRQLNNYINANFPDKVLFWVGGGRSWNAAVNCVIKQELSLFSNYNVLDQISILPINFDVFVVSNHQEVHKKVMCAINDYFENLVTAFKDFKDLSDDYTLSKKNSLFNKSCNTFKFPEEKGSCVLFPCQSMQVNISSKNTAKVKLSDKMVFYLEGSYIEFMDIQLLKNSLLYDNCENYKNHGINYLTPRGLIFFYFFMIHNRKTKGVNIDRIRYNLLTEILSQVNQVIPGDFIDLYIRLFKSNTGFDKKILSNIILHSLKTQGIDIEEIIQLKVTETLRGYVNTFISLLNMELIQNGYGNLFIVGGDAMRRYTDKITKTADIDTKVFIPESSNKTRSGGKRFNEILDFILVRLCKFSISLKNKLGELFASLEQINQDVIIDYSKTKIRPRLIEANENFMVNLFSLDVRCYYSYRGNYNNVTYAVLDMAIIRETQEPVNTIPPVASREFLLHDLNNTYNTQSLALGRYFSDKVKKDNQRFELLSDPNEKASKLNLEILNTVFPFAVLEADIQEYNNYFIEFKKVIEENRKENYYKHKIKFGTMN